MTKSDQVRVRIENGHRERLLEIAAARGRGETLSDMIRQAIGDFISPEAVKLQDSHFIAVTALCQRRIADLAAELNRSQTQVLEDCVEGIHDSLEDKRVPLIIFEVHLRRKYRRQESPEAVLNAVDAPAN